LLTVNEGDPMLERDASGTAGTAATASATGTTTAELTPAGPRSGGGGPGRGGRVVQFVLRYGIVLALLALGAFFASQSDVFLRSGNLLGILLQASVNTIVALGITFVIITAGIDSLRRLDRRPGGDGRRDRDDGRAPPPRRAAALGLGGPGRPAGRRRRRPHQRPPHHLAPDHPFIVTLGMLSVARGLTLIVSQGRPVFGFPKGSAASSPAPSAASRCRS
jgi:hypothetical protein